MGYSSGLNRNSSNRQDADATASPSGRATSHAASTANRQDRTGREANTPDRWTLGRRLSRAGRRAERLYLRGLRSRRLGRDGSSRGLTVMILTSYGQGSRKPLPTAR